MDQPHSRKSPLAVEQLCLVCKAGPTRRRHVSISFSSVFYASILPSRGVDIESIWRASAVLPSGAMACRMARSLVAMFFCSAVQYVGLGESRIVESEFSSRATAMANLLLREACPVPCEYGRLWEHAFVLIDWHERWVLQTTLL